ncbi:MAG: shikimate kinase, partial [Acidimicrobiaceae bacterium]
VVPDSDAGAEEDACAGADALVVGEPELQPPAIPTRGTTAAAAAAARRRIRFEGTRRSTDQSRSPDDARPTLPYGRAMPRHWVLIGLMGAGKTTVGELLASRSGRRFFDNDAQLSAITGRTARQVQAEQGREALHELARRVDTEQHRPVDADARAQLREQSASRSASFAEVADILVDADRPPSEIVDDVLVALSERTD